MRKCHFSSCRVPSFLLHCLFVYLLSWKRHHYQWKAAIFDICSALMATDQRGFFCMPHLLWYRTSVCNGHLWGPVTLPNIAKRLAVELSLPVLTTLVCRCWIRPVILRIFSSKWELIATVSKLNFYQSIWWIEYTVLSPRGILSISLEKILK